MRYIASSSATTFLTEVVAPSEAIAPAFLSEQTQSGAAAFANAQGLIVNMPVIRVGLSQAGEGYQVEGVEGKGGVFWAYDPALSNVSATVSSSALNGQRTYEAALARVTDWGVITVPEASTSALMGLGLLGMGLVARRRKAEGR